MYNPQRPVQLPPEQALTLSKTFHPDGQPSPAHVQPPGGPRGSCPPSPGAHPAGTAGWGAAHRAWRGGGGHRAGGRAPPQAPTGRQPASEPDRKQEKTTRAAWKSPPGPMPECDSVGLAGQLPSRPSAGTQGAGPQEAAQPLHRHGHGSPSGLFTALQMPSQSRRDRVVPT